MRSLKRIELSVIFMASATLGGCLGDEVAETDEPSSEVTGALASDCEGGRNGFVDIRDDLAGASHPRTRPVTFTDLTVSLEVGTIAGRQHGWAKLNGPNTRPGDLVWMDWSSDRHTTWLQCGPFEVTRAGMPKTSAAMHTARSKSWQFRACARRRPWPTSCTDWW